MLFKRCGKDATEYYSIVIFFKHFKKMSYIRNCSNAYWKNLVKTKERSETT